MELKIKFLKWSAGVPVVMLNTRTAEKLGAHATDRIFIRTNSKEFLSIVDTIGDIVNPNEIAVSSELKEILHLKLGQKVDVNLAPFPKSLNFIKKKLENRILSKSEINEIVKDVMNNSLSEAEIALFISATYKQGMNLKEIAYLTEAILDSGRKLKIKGKLIADKHSIGGIAGNRTTPIVVPICASSGLIIPKNSSRAITSAAGTADVIETLAKVDFSVNEIERIIKKTGACMVWGGALELVPADSKIISIEKQLKIDSEPLLLSSVMSKKLAAGSNYILIDIPYGKDAKVNKEKALELKRKFEYLGRYFHKKIKVLLTKGDEPIGNGIGPVLEMMDVIKVLNHNHKEEQENFPYDLEKKSLFLAGQIFELTGKSKKGKGEELAKQILYSGRAYEKFKEIIKAQEGTLKTLSPGKYKKDFFSKSSGKILNIDNKLINSLARVAGCPVDKKSGVYLYNHVGKKIKKRNKLLTIYTESPSRLKEAANFYNDNKIIKLK